LLLVAALLALCTASAGAEVVVINGISLPPLARALVREPVQLRGTPQPTLTHAQVLSLRALIEARDRGRLWIAVVTPMSLHSVGELADAVGNDIPHDGVLLAVAGYNFFVASSWGNLDPALNSAVEDPNLSFYELLRRSIVAFAAADVRAHHPTPYADQLASQHTPKAHSTTTTGTSTGTSTGTTATAPAGKFLTSTVPAAETSGSGGGGGGSVVLPVLGGIVPLIVLVGIGRGLLGTRRASHRRREEHADATAKLHSDFIKLGDRIRDLDIDSSMPNASPEGKAEYTKGLDCYQGAERRMKNLGDAYEFEKTGKVVASGLKHMANAERLFSESGKARDVLPAEVIDQLTKLAALHRSGALTDAEFAAQKQKLLS
jgi:hypothetical protein